MVDALYGTQFDADTEYFYWEMLGLYKDVFVVFSLDESEGVIYQESLDGEKYRLEKGSSTWIPFDGATPEQAVRVSRKYAERLEDNWADIFGDNEMTQKTDAS